MPESFAASVTKCSFCGAPLEAIPAENIAPAELNRLGSRCCYDEGKYSKAVEYYTKAAEKGNADAMYNPATLCFQGEGVSPDFEKAFEWYRKAAENGSAEAQNFLELNSLHSISVPAKKGKPADGSSKGLFRRKNNLPGIRL